MKIEEGSCQSRDTSYRQSWVEEWVLKSGLRNYGSSRSFKSRALVSTVFKSFLDVP